MKKKATKIKKETRASRASEIKISIKTRQLGTDIIECLPNCTMRRMDQCGIYSDALPIFFYKGKKECRLVCRACKWLIESIARYEEAK